MKYLGLAHILADGFAGVGGVGAMIACLGPAHILADRYAGVGGGWDDNVPWPLRTWLDTQDGAKRSESYGAKRSDSDGAKRSSDHTGIPSSKYRRHWDPIFQETLGSHPPSIGDTGIPSSRFSIFNWDYGITAVPYMLRI